MDLIEEYGLGKASLAMNSFVASQHPSESCGHNGLPLTPNSIGILGRAEILKSISHPNLCSYLDFQRGQHERIVCVSEWNQSSVKDIVFEDPHEWMSIAQQTLSALHYLDENDMVVVNLTANNIVFNGDKTVKLYNYGLSHMTDYGVLVSFPIFDVRSVAPEVLLQGLPKNTVPGSELQGDEEMDSIRKEHLHFLNA